MSPLVRNLYETLTVFHQPWTKYEKTRRHVLFRELGIKRSRNASPVLMVVPSDWTKEEHERITQIFFENFNVPGLYLAEEPLMILYGCATVTGLIIDIGHNSTGNLYGA